MKLKPLPPKRALNKGFFKQRPLRSEIDLFKGNLIKLLDKIDEIEREENQKNHIRDFLRDTSYKDTNEINTKDTKDLVIHLGKSNKDKVGVIIEAKRPGNKSEWITADKPNRKALQELVLYYLRERIEEKNIDIKYCITTNIYEWFIIDAAYFEKLFFRNKTFVKQYENWRDGKMVTKDTSLFYNDIAKSFIDKLEDEIPCTFFDIRDYEKELKNEDKEDDKKLIALLKILSPYHLLRVPFADDHNKLDERFYKELLHIIGLEEVKEGSKIVIRRKKSNKNPASLIENAINILDTEDPLHKVKDLNLYGDNRKDRLFNIALELSITWMNRVLFLKLLEGQLVNYHNGDKQQLFLNSELINDYDELHKLFHQVLARTHSDRTDAIKKKYGHVPYLNSSLFEVSELEDQTIRINSLDNSLLLDLIGSTILKDEKRKAKNLPSLDYLFKFLDAYDFASEGADDIQEDDNKTLINASVLGKVFEKINGYKDGSIFTPGFITMYMCRQAVKLAVIKKFNDEYGWKVKSIEGLKNYLADRRSTKEILAENALINSLHLCDPAVGSGHFLVSALNEIIAIKAELGLLADNRGSRITDFELVVENDELIVTDLHGDIFKYQIVNGKPLTKETQRLQKTLFHEKQTIIENCLFGVDINKNSVKICRLRLWIELLKNAYYKESACTELETLPNIDINIKCGNSLLSRFTLDADLSKALKSIKYNITQYRAFVNDYKNERNREVKRGLQKIIDTIKNDFKSNIDTPFKTKIAKARGNVDNIIAEINTKKLWGDKLTKELKEKLNKATEKLAKAEKEKEEILSNKIYINAFEWRFEFPEVLDNKGNYLGFDLIIGNPPYIKEYEHRQAFDGLRDQECYQGKMDIWYLFGDLGIKLLKPDSILAFIATNNWVTNAGASKFRNIIINKSQILNLTDFGAYMIFENASIQTMIMLFRNNATVDNYSFDCRRLQGEKLTEADAIMLIEGAQPKNSILLTPTITKDKYIGKSLVFSGDNEEELLDKIKSKQNFSLDAKKEVAQGIVPNPDVVNSRNISKLAAATIMKEGITVGDGVFVVPLNYFKKLSVKEKKYIKPVYEPYLVDRYSHASYDKEMIYTTKKNFKNDAPAILAHLKKFKPIMEQRRENQQGKIEYCHLHWPRDESFFSKGAKILSVRKCAQPTFLYTENEAYVMMAFNIIRSSRINLKYLSGLLNSKLITFWLRKKGKMQGNAYQVDKEPLLDLPILKPSEREMKKIASLVAKIFAQKQKTKDTQTLEAKIDKEVYKLYDIELNEQNIIEGK